MDTVLHFIELFSSHNGLLTALATIVLSIITYLYLRETKKLRVMHERILFAENSIVNIEVSTVEFNSDKSRFWFELKLRNIGSKPTKSIEFKLLTRRSPKECISQIITLATREEYLKQKSSGTILITKFYHALMPGENVTFYCEVLSSFLDYDKSFYIWIKYLDFYGKHRDEIRLVSLADAVSQSITNFSMIQELNKKVSLPVTYF